MNICPFCNQVINQNYNIVLDNYLKKYYHYSCYQILVVDNLSEQINQIKFKSNTEIIKFLFIDDKIKLSDLEKKAVKDYFISNPIAELVHSDNKFNLENQKNNLENININSKQIQTDLELNLDDKLDVLIEKLKNSQISKITDKEDKPNESDNSDIYETDSDTEFWTDSESLKTARSSI
jgi:uncharacterized coiled-coil protein SlyX